MKIEYPGSLHNHSEYSNLRLRDSISKIPELINKAISLGHKAIAFTEHETISNAIKIEEYYNKIQKDNPDFKVILGNEIYLCRDGLNADNFNKELDKYFHFILLAKDAVGHQQIRELSTRAWKRSYKTGKMTRVPTYFQDLFEVICPNPGHVIGSTACLGGFLGTKLLEYNLNQDEEFFKKIINWVRQMEKIFGKGNFYLEMQPSDNEEQICVNKLILQLSEITSIPYIITTDTHYTNKEDRPIHKAYLTSQEGDREVDDFYSSTYLMGTEEIENYMGNYFNEEILNTAYLNILNIIDKCERYSLLKPLKIPSLKWKIPMNNINVKDWYDKIPMLETFMNSDFDGDQRLAELVVEKLILKPELQEEKIYQELNENLDATWQSSLVNKAHWSAYFLNLQKIIDICWEAGSLVGPGRGSGVGFTLLYVLDIIQINNKWETTDTFGWRFLNPSRVSVLDIDTDIEGTKRAQVLQALRNYYGEDRVANVVTFGTEKPRSAIQTAARGLGIEVDKALYISSLVPKDRGIDRTLTQCYYGDEENGFEPVPLFVQQMNENPELWQVAQRIEGLVNKIGEHAGGVIFVDEPFTNATALMRVPNGDLVTQFDLHDAEKASLIKIDLLSIEALDKIHNCLDLLIDAGRITPEKTLRETYEKYLGIYTLERENPKMWEMVHDHKIQALFQMEQQSGIQGIRLTKPQSVDDLSVLNSVIRLMAQSKDEEQPLVKYARFKNDIGLWYKEMRNYHLTPEEQKILEPILKISYGIAESQEKIMQLVQLPECGGFDLTWADSLRKAVAKKQPEAYLKLQEQYFTKVKENNLSENLCHYVWDVLIAMSRGYSFNASHTLAYSLVALQEMNLAFKYPIIYWDTACLITDSGGAESEDDEDKTNDYNKIALALNKVKELGVKVVLPDINKSKYTFSPDVENNTIVFGWRGIVSVGDDLIKEIIEKRPYSTPKDFYNKIHPNKTAMLSLIKCGAFDNLMDRKDCMIWYIWEQCDKKNNLTLQNMSSLLKYNLVPSGEEYDLAKRIYDFNRYLKAVCKIDNNVYKPDERALNFLLEIGFDDLVYENGQMFAKEWDKIYQSYMNIFRNWLNRDKNQVLEELNRLIFLEDWNKYAKGNYSTWEMEVLSCYYHEHELIGLNKGKYGFSDFDDLPKTPIVDKTFTKGDKTITMFKLFKIYGTCIAKNKDKATVTLLTPNGIATVKFRKEYFAMFDKQISVIGGDGKKHVVEKSWFNRGSMIVVQGIRSEDAFIPKKYASSGGHQLYKIKSIDEDGNVLLANERYQGGIEEDV